MIGTILKNEKGEIISQASPWQPPEPVKNLTKSIEQDYEIGFGILNRSYPEFNDFTLIQRMNLDQKAFNSYVEHPSDDPENAWRWDGVRPTTRNKVLGMAGHMVAATLIPGIFAQNDLDEEDKEAANVMKYLVEHSIKNSNYEIAYRQVVIGALVNPVAYLHIDYAEVMQTIKERAANGEIKETEIIDELLSGLQTYSVPPEEIMIENVYQPFIQNQRFLIRRRFVGYSDLKARYKNHPNWIHVRPGIKAFYDEATDTFYDQYDDSLNTLGEECIYYNRTEDIEVPYVNGIYMGDANVKANPMKHRNNKNAPKYPYAKTGFSLVDEGRFFYYKSLVFHMADDQELEDRVTRLLVDSGVLEAEPPMAGIGIGNVDSSVISPGQLTPFKADSSITTIGTGRNLGNLFSLLNNIENQIDRDSLSRTEEGQITPGNQTKWEIQRAERNAMVQRGIFGRMIGDIVKDSGDLIIDINLMHTTVGEAEETLGGLAKLKFRTLLLPNQTEKGRKITRKLVFDDSLMGKKFTKKELLRHKAKKVTENGGLKADTLIYNINPRRFRNLKFTVEVEYEELMPRSRNMEEAKAIRDYNLMRNDPLFDQKQVARDLAEALKHGESDKYITKKEIPAEVLDMSKPRKSEEKLEDIMAQ